MAGVEEAEEKKLNEFFRRAADNWDPIITDFARKMFLKVTGKRPKVMRRKHLWHDSLLFPAHYLWEFEQKVGRNQISISLLFSVDGGDHLEITVCSGPSFHANNQDELNAISGQIFESMYKVYIRYTS